jgi:hypothetical protein
MKPVTAPRRKKTGTSSTWRRTDLLIRIFDITEDTELLPIVLHLNNLRPMYKK